MTLKNKALAFLTTFCVGERERERKNEKKEKKKQKKKKISIFFLPRERERERERETNQLFPQVHATHTLYTLTRNAHARIKEGLSLSL